MNHAKRMANLHRLHYLAYDVSSFGLREAFCLHNVVLKLTAPRILHDQIELLLHDESLMKLDYVAMAQLFEYFGLFVNFVDQVGSREVLTDVNRFHGNHFFSFFMLRPVDLSETAFPQKFIQSVLIYDLSHVEGAPAGFQVKLISFLHEIHVFLLDGHPAQIIQNTVALVVLTHLLADGLEQRFEFFELAQWYVALSELGAFHVVQTTV